MPTPANNQPQINTTATPPPCIHLLFRNTPKTVIHPIPELNPVYPTQETTKHNARSPHPTTHHQVHHSLGDGGKGRRPAHGFIPAPFYPPKPRRRGTHPAPRTTPQKHPSMSSNGGRYAVCRDAVSGTRVLRSAKRCPGLSCAVLRSGIRIGGSWHRKSMPSAEQF